MAQAGPTGRVLMAYKYTNHAITGRHRQGILWVDSDTKQVVWQNGDDATRWHGSYEETAHMLKVRFDAFAENGGDIGPRVNASVHM